MGINDFMADQRNAEIAAATRDERDELKDQVGRLTRLLKRTVPILVSCEHDGDGNCCYCNRDADDHHPNCSLKIVLEDVRKELRKDG